MFSKSCSLALKMTLVVLFCLPVIAQGQAIMDTPHDPQGCLTCHDILAFDQPSMIPNDPPYAPIDMDDTLFNSICLGCHDGIIASEAHTHSSLTTSNKYGNWSVGCSVCHNQHTQEQIGSTVGANGAFIRNVIDLSRITGLAKTGYKPVKLLAETGPNSFADGDAVYDGICEVCHTQTTHFRNDGSGGDQNHGGKQGQDCASCHIHNTGFIGGGAHDFIIDDTNVAATQNCSDCHTGYNTSPETAHSSCTVCHTAPPTLVNSNFPNGTAPDYDGPSMFANLLASPGGYVNLVTGPITDSDGTNISDVGGNGVFEPIKCGYCHVAKPGDLDIGEHGGHAAADWDYSAATDDCVDCHADGGNGTIAGAGVHNNNCALCHTDPAGGDYTRRAGTDGDATGMVGRTGTCTACHTVTKPFIHHDTADAVATPTSACTSCHTGTGATGHAGNHDALVAIQNPPCQGCHATAAASGGDNVPLDPAATPAGDLMHDYCTSCHVVGAGNIIETVATPTAHATTMNNADGTTATDNGGGTCTACHTTYFDTHGHDHTATVIVNTGNGSNTVNCIGCHTTATAGSGPFIGTAHTNCTTCHDTANNGAMKGSAATADINGIATDGAFECGECHASYFDGHDHAVDNAQDSGSAEHSVAMGSDQAGTQSCNDCHNTFNDNWSGSNDIAALHTGGCAQCHNSTRDATPVGAGTETVAQLITNYVSGTIACLDCHDDRSVVHMDHLANDQDANTFGAVLESSQCTSCHKGGGTPGSLTDSNMMAIHNVSGGGCGTCHVSASGAGVLRDYSGTGGNIGEFVNYETLAPYGAGSEGHGGTCVDCHASYGTSFKAGHKNEDHVNRALDTDMLAATANCTTTCHVAADAATIAGTLHSTCNICHTNDVTNGTLKNATNGNASGHTINSQSTCANCHGDYNTNFLIAHDTKDHSGLGTSANCTITCHNIEIANLDATPDVHNDNCTNCHTNTVGNGTLVDGSVNATSWGGTAANRGDATVADGGDGIRTCAECHGAYDSNYITGHQTEDHSGLTTTASCVSCHDGDILIDTKTHGSGAVAYCTWCHNNSTNNGTLMNRANANATNHNIYGPQSTCATCHTTRAAAFNAHSVKDHNGVGTSANCVNCHTGHVINSPNTHNFACAWCHVDVFGTDGSLRDGTDAGTPQGTTSVGNATGHDIEVVSTCVDCHGAHNTDFTVGHLNETHVEVTNTGSAECIACHTGANIIVNVHSNNCELCHTDTTIPVTDGSFTGSASGHLIGTPSACIDCHSAEDDDFGGGHTTENHFEVTAPANTAIQSNDCDDCHTGNIITATVNHKNNCNSCHIDTVVAGGTDGRFNDGTTAASAFGATSVGSATGHTLGAASTCLDCHAATYFSNTAQHSSATHSVAIDGDTSGGQSCSTASCHQGQSENWANIRARHDLSSTTADVCHVCHDSTRDADTIEVGTGGIQKIITDNVGQATIVSCLDCHTDKSVGHGGHDATHFGGDAQCTVCHTIPGTGVVNGLHSNNCDLCHVGGVYNALSEGVGPDANLDGVVDGDAGGANGAAGAGTPFNPSVYTCLDCHNASGDPTGNIDPTTTGGIHHDTPTTDAGNCHTCHTDPRPTPTGMAHAPYQMSCRACHVDVSGTTVTVMAITEGIAGSTANGLFSGNTRSAVPNHSFTITSGTGAGKIVNYGSCLDCHGTTGWGNDKAGVQTAGVGKQVPFHPQKTWAQMGGLIANGQTQFRIGDAGDAPTGTQAFFGHGRTRFNMKNAEFSIQDHYLQGQVSWQNNFGGNTDAWVANAANIPTMYTFFEVNSINGGGNFVVPVFDTDYINSTQCSGSCDTVSIDPARCSNGGTCIDTRVLTVHATSDDSTAQLTAVWGGVSYPMTCDGGSPNDCTLTVDYSGYPALTRWDGTDINLNSLWVISDKGGSDRFEDLQTR